MRKRKWKRVFAVYVCFFILMAVCILAKKNYHVDEMYSYGLSNYQQGLYINLDEFHTYEPAREAYLDYLTVGTEERFDYEMVWRNQAEDVHPPLYYMILHTICSFFPGVYSKWFAASINIVFALATLWIVRKILRFFISDSKMRDFISIVFIMSAGFLNATAFFRMYVMTMFEVGLFSYLILKPLYGERKESWAQWYIKLFLTAVMGAMTHYYCIIYIVLISLVYCVSLLVKKHWKEVLGFLGTMAASGCVSLCLFPAMISHVFESGRGTQSIENLREVSGYLERIQAFVQIFFQQLFGGYVMLGIMALMLFLLIIKGDFSGGKCLRLLGIDESFEMHGYVLLGIPTLVYFLLISKIAVFLTDRYMYPIYPIVFVLGTCFIVKAVEQLFDTRYRMAVVSVLFLFMVTSGLYTAEWGYLYREFVPMLEKSKECSQYDCVVVYEYDWTLPSLYPEIENYQSVTFVHGRDFEQLLSSELLEDEIIVTCVGMESGTKYFEGIYALPEKAYEREKIGSFSYGTSWLYYKNK